jgi:secretion/DNA translocation related TadE-like protein
VTNAEPASASSPQPHHVVVATIARQPVDRRRECGSTTVVLAAVLPIVLVLAMGTADLGRTLVARSRARSAADAAALAAVQEMALPSGREPAEIAREYAIRGGGEMTACSCDPDGYEAVVDVQVPVGDLLLLPGSPVATARARAVVDLPTG